MRSARGPSSTGSGRSPGCWETRAAGLGDDCGLVREGEEFLALSTDVSVEGVHFRLDWIGPEEVGWRSAAAALSDLAAEGAEPIGLLCAVTMPAAAREAELLELMAGVGAAAKPRAPWCWAAISPRAPPGA